MIRSGLCALRDGEGVYLAWQHDGHRSAGGTITLLDNRVKCDVFETEIPTVPSVSCVTVNALDDNGLVLVAGTPQD